MQPPLEEGNLPRTAPYEWRTVVAALVVGLIVLCAYWNGLTGAFVFDDQATILGNPSIRHLWPVWSALFPPADLTTTGRPFPNCTFAISYALSGNNPWGYHAVNVFIHILGCLTLFGIVRRTLCQPMLRRSFERDSLPLAFVVTLLWGLHPLQTEAVTYVAQRVESLMGLCYLQTLYCFVRSVEVATPGRWRTLSILACAMGMTSKEVMVSAPLVVLLYDRTFAAGSFAESWKQRRTYYLALGTTWLLVATLAVASGNRGGTAGAGTSIAWSAYVTTQFEAVVTYLRLAVWPHPLVFDYGTIWLPLARALPYALPVVALVAATIWALARAPAHGFLGFWFIAILAPSSSVIPIATQPVAEHRMYLSLAAIVASAVLSLYTWTGRRIVAAFMVLAIILGELTVERNGVYRDPLSLWSDTVAKRPANSRAQNALGVALNIAQRTPEAIIHFEEALRLHPDDQEAHDNLGTALVKVGRTTEAIAQFEIALRENPTAWATHLNLGIALAGVTTRQAEAIPHFEAALRLNPGNWQAHYLLGNALAEFPEFRAKAVEHYKAAVGIYPDYWKAQWNLAVVLFALPERRGEALPYCEAALRLNPGFEPARNMRQNLLSGSKPAAAGPRPDNQSR